MGPSAVVVRAVPDKDGPQVPLAEDQNAVRDSVLAVSTKRSAKQFARGHRGGILTVAIPAPARTASKAVVNWPARSRTRNRKVAARSSRSISRFLAFLQTVEAPIW